MPDTATDNDWVFSEWNCRGLIDLREEIEDADAAVPPTLVESLTQPELRSYLRAHHAGLDQHLLQHVYLSIYPRRVERGALVMGFQRFKLSAYTRNF